MLNGIALTIILVCDIEKELINGLLTTVIFSNKIVSPKEIFSL